MTPASWALSGVFAAGGLLMLAEGSREDAERLGDALQLALPASAYSMTWIARDGRGAAQYSIQLGAGLATTHGLKFAVTKRTPTAADFNSFPSAHTQAAFSGAAFIHRRFGPRWGVPAYVLAAYTGLSRVKADRHYLDDVIAGMSIALMSNWAVVTPIDDRVRLNPTLTDGGLGVTVTIDTSKAEQDRRVAERPGPSDWRFVWEVGRIAVTENTIQAPEGEGDSLDFRFRERNNPAVTSNLEIGRRLGKRHDLTARLAPFEVREIEHFPHPVTFGGVTFDNEPIETRSVGYDLRVRWRMEMVPDSIARVAVGTGVEAIASRAEINFWIPDPGGPDLVGRGRNLEVLPILHAHLGVAPGPVEIFAEADGVDLGADRYLDLVAGLTVRFGRHWRIGVNYRKVEWSVGSSRLSHDFSASTPSMTAAYFW